MRSSSAPAAPRLPWARQRPDPGLVPLHRPSSTLRRWASAGLVAAGSAAALGVLAPTPLPGVPVLAATRDVPAGATLRAADLRVERRAPAEVPSTALTAVHQGVGRTLGAPLAAGELVSTARLVGDGLLRGRPPSQVVAPVRLADAEVAALLEPGSHVDLLVGVETGVQARTVARYATVLARPEPRGDGGGGLLPTSPDGGAGGLVLVAVTGTTAARLAQAAAHGPLSAVLR